MGNKIFPKMFGEVNCFAKTLQPITWLNQLVGMSVIEYPIGQLWLKLSIISYLIKGFMYGSLLYYCENYTTRKSHLKIQIAFIAYYVVRFIVIASVVFIGVLNISTCKARTLHIKKMTMIDAILKEFGIDPEYSNEGKRNLYICLIWCILSVFIHISSCVSAYNTYCSVIHVLIKGIVYSIPLTINLLTQLKIGELISIMARRFERLNALTHRIVESTRGKTMTKNVNKYHRIIQRNQQKNASEDSKTKYKANIVVNLKTVRQIHLYLCGTTREMMETYGAEVLCYTTSIFILVTCFAYITYLIFNTPTLSPPTKILHYCFLWFSITVNLSAMTFIMKSGASVMEEARKTSHLAYEIQSIDQEVLNEMHQLSLQVMQHPLYLTASGFFKLDLVYVRGIIGSVATYFMILIQNRPYN